MDSALVILAKSGFSLEVLRQLLRLDPDHSLRTQFLEVSNLVREFLTSLTTPP